MARFEGVEPFVRWGTSHWVSIGLTIVAPLVVAAWTRRGEGSQRERAVGIVFALVLVGNLLAALWWRESKGFGWREQLPLHLCDWTAVACGIACLTRRRLWFEFAYYWAFAGSLHGLITPDLPYGFPAPQFWIFFIGHGAVIGSVIYLLLGPQLRPTMQSAIRAYVGLLGYGLVAGVANLALGTNYGYLRYKPVGPSLLDHLGPWPWYIFSLAGVGAVSFLILTLPWTVARRARGKD